VGVGVLLFTSSQTTEGDVDLILVTDDHGLWRDIGGRLPTRFHTFETTASGLVSEETAGLVGTSEENIAAARWVEAGGLHKYR
jgi:hypothetical protein